MTTPPDRILIYHIVHVDRLTSIADDGFLWSDAGTKVRECKGTTIGIQSAKDRRLYRRLSSHPKLKVGLCVPFYFCPRSIMLHTLHRGKHRELTYKDGQEPIVHLVAEFSKAVTWAKGNSLRWAFTSTNAASDDFDDWSNRSDLHHVNWDAIRTSNWRDHEIYKAKQAEFLIERRFPWCLVIGIGVHNETVAQRVREMMQGRDCRPNVKVLRAWYF